MGLCGWDTPVTHLLSSSALHQEFLLLCSALLCFSDCNCDHSLRAAINLTICLVQQTHQHQHHHYHQHWKTSATKPTRTRKVSTASGHIWRILRQPPHRCQKPGNLSCGKQKANKACRQLGLAPGAGATRGQGPSAGFQGGCPGASRKQELNSFESFRNIVFPSRRHLSP